MEKIDTLEEAIKNNSLVGIYSVFYTIAHGDPNFTTGKFYDVLAYVQSKNIAGFMKEFDGDEFETEENWDEDYWALIASSLMDNFCEIRIKHLEEVGKKVYPEVSKKQHINTGVNNKNTMKTITSRQNMGDACVSGIKINKTRKRARMDQENQRNFEERRNQKYRSEKKSIIDIIMSKFGYQKNSYFWEEYKWIIVWM